LNCTRKSKSSVKKFYEHATPEISRLELKLKTHAIQIGKAIGAILLLIVLVKGIAVTLLYISPAKDWRFETEDGDYSDVRLSVGFFGGLILWFWLLCKIKRAEMNDEDKKDLDRHIKNSEDENDL